MRALASLLLAVCAAGCGVPPGPAGDEYGVYGVVGTLSAHECGQKAAPIQLPYARDLELRRAEGGLGYLYGSDGAIMQGTLASDGRFRFTEQSGVRVIEPDEVFGVRGCDLMVTTTLEGVAPRAVDEETGEAELAHFEGSLVTRIAPSGGSDCSELLFGSSSGGNFEALPCAIELELEGEPVAPDEESDAQ